MNYELARKLKKAGYPQTGRAMNIYGKKYKGTFAEYRKPLLSELIRACGDEIEAIERSGDGNWHAKMTGSNLMFPPGSTPEEAVANLWLELNKKDHA